MVVDGDGEGLLGRLLADHVLVQDVLDLDGRRDFLDRLGNLALLVFLEDFVTERDAFITNVDRRAGDEFPDRILRLATEGTA